MVLGPDGTPAKPSPGRPVTVDQVARMAKPRCRTCSGTGVYKIRTPRTSKFRDVVCLCAAQAFHRAHPELIQVEGTFYWPDTLPAPSPSAPQTAPDAPESTIAPPEVPTPSEQPDEAPNASYAATRLARLETAREAAQQEYDAVQAKVYTASQTFLPELESLRALAAAETTGLGELHYQHASLQARVDRTKEQMTELATRLGVLKGELQGVEEQQTALSESLQATRSVISEVETRMLKAGSPYRSQQRKAQERLAQLDKRIARVKGHLP